jgi:hypothetical protein
VDHVAGGLPFLAHGRELDVAALALPEALGRELQPATEGRVGRGQPGECRVDALFRALQLAAVCTRRPRRRIAQALVIGDRRERRDQFPLVGVAIQLVAGEVDVLAQIDQRQHRAERQRERRGQQPQPPGDRQSMEPGRAGRCGVGDGGRRGHGWTRLCWLAHDGPRPGWRDVDESRVTMPCTKQSAAGAAASLSGAGEPTAACRDPLLK